MSNFDCLSCEHGDKCTLYMATGCGHAAYAIAFYVKSGNYCPSCGAKMDGGAE